MSSGLVQSDKNEIGEWLEPPTFQKTVHIVDDLADRLQFASMALEHAGYCAILHSSFSAFVREFQVRSCHAVVIDIHIGDNDAIDVLDFLSQNKCKASLYLISGDPDGLISARRYAEEVGLQILGCIQKPFTGKQLLEQIRQGEQSGELSLGRLDVEEAIQNDWIYPVLQPKLHLASGKIESAELLSRMAHPVFGIVGPQHFIGRMNIAQSQALFLKQVTFVRNHFNNNLQRWKDFQVSVNVSPESLVLLRNRLVQLSVGIPNFYRNLMMEITEEQLAVISAQQLKSIYKMNIEGARFSIDDFGAGGSNFARLSRLPFCEIKIDRSIIHGCSEVSARRIMLRSIIKMAHELGARVVAEGVEAHQDFTFLEESKCDIIQGYVVSYPLGIEEFSSFVADFNGAANRHKEKKNRCSLHY